MTGNTPHENVRQTLVILWAALAVSQVIYGFLPVAPPGPDVQTQAALPIALGVVAFAIGVGAVVLLRVRAFGPIARGEIDPATREGGGRLFPTLLIAWVLAESIAIYGLVLRFLHHGPGAWAPFTAAGALLLFLGRPWQARLQPPASSAELARSNAPFA